MTGQVMAVIGSVVGVVIAAVFGYVNSTRANRPAESNAQLAWVKQAQEEAGEARKEAKEAKAESAAARFESEQTRQQLVKIRREMDAMQDWMDRVMRAGAAYRAERPSGVEDSGVIRILKAINGGPRFERDGAQ